ncbi:hypothetical protein JI435_418150 [Parastagonospora nodorum SN15]|uniref:Uncharacterized protein n=1 Tax=Phaeosphaeria nodorum (strain SN15 / ATCC MYA-4574 / FGSC 10173) TaxID=321614 RepID=A0A7U2FC18_PHANO|nr:hypothetical protein JI435_418150 [Parastagonospora nodorum SN15]
MHVDSIKSTLLQYSTIVEDSIDNARMYVTSADSQSLSVLGTSVSRSGAQPWACSPLRAARKQARH